MFPEWRGNGSTNWYTVSSIYCHALSPHEARKVSGKSAISASTNGNDLDGIGTSPVGGGKLVFQLRSCLEASKKTRGPSRTSAKRFVPSGLESDELWALSSRETAVLLDVQYSPFGNPRHRFVLLLSPLVPIIIDRLHLSKRSFRFTSASFVLESVREGPVAPRPPPTRKLDGRHSSTIGLMDNQ